jgi:tight adherence protein C
MDISFLLVVSTAFIAVAGVVFVLGEFLVRHSALQRRLVTDGSAIEPDSQSAIGGFEGFISENFGEEKFGVDGKFKRKLRSSLLRAGFFHPIAIRYYVFARICSVIFLPIITYMLCVFLLPHLSMMFVSLLAAIAAVIGVLAPDTYISRRQTRLMNEYRLVFPDLLDLLTVCVSAGLSLEGSFERIRDQLGKRSFALGRNIDLMSAEMRAGKTSVEALSSFSDRLGLDEAASFVGVLRQSLELGGDVAVSLRVFSDEMRSTRMLRAEEKANALPVKMVLPLALGIFPVILTIALLPVVLKLLKVMNQT